MIDFEDLILKRSDFLSVIFKEFLLKIGQISTDTIFTTDSFKAEISYHRDKFFLNLLKPLHEYTDCVIRIKDVGKPDLNFIFLIKEEIINEYTEYLKKDTAKAKIPNPITIEQIKQYKKEINQNNIIKFIQYFKNNSKIDINNTILEIEEKSKYVFPYEKNKISLDLYNISRIIFPNFDDYLRKIITIAKEKINEEIAKKEYKRKLLYENLDNKEIYWDDEKKSIPSYPDILSRLYKEIFIGSEYQYTRNDIEQFFKEENKFIMIKVINNNLSTNEIIDKYEGAIYRIVKNNDNTIDIYENGKATGWLINQTKTKYLKRKIKELIIPNYTIDFKTNYKENYYDEEVLVLYKDKINDILEKSIQCKEHKQLKVMHEILKNIEEFKEQKIEYDLSLIEIINNIEDIKVNQAILSFMNKYEKNLNIFQKLISLLFSPWKNESIEKNITLQKNRIEKISKEIQPNRKDEIGDYKPNIDYNPVQIAINIIKEDLKKMEIREILAKNITNNEKIIKILDMYKDIGATNKAIITKSEKSQNDFLSKIRDLLK